ncbi:S-layer homology domain-containing protein [Faecalibacterium sp. OF04-11AC]|nr:S-layer homology domain-containing protein [Faecalibacterium sp. OF04-11AC]
MAGLRPGHEPLSGALAPGGFRHAQDPRRACPPAVEHGRRPAPAAQPAFTDITDPDTAQAAQWAVETGLMTSKSADRFKPEKSVTRWKAIRSWKRVTNQNT